MNEKAASQGYSSRDLACTLLAFVATSNWIAAMQIGDGFIVVRQQDSDYRLMFRPDKGEYANETTFVVSRNARDAMLVDVLEGKQRFICASTDGLERVAIDLRSWQLGARFFQPLEEYMQTTLDPEKEDEYIVDFLKSERLNSRTDDDKTLLLFFYDSEENEGQLVNSGTESNSVSSEALDSVKLAFISFVLAGFLLHINNHLVSDNFGVHTAIGVVIIVVICLVIVLSIVQVKLRKAFSKLQSILMVNLTFLLGMTLG